MGQRSWEVDVALGRLARVMETAGIEEWARHAEQLRLAIMAGGLTLHFQPEVDLRDGRVVGLEALLRWPDAPPHLAGPAEFVAVAERSNLIVPLGALVIDRAVAAAARLRGSTDQPVRVWVNLGAGQLADPAQLVDTFDAALRRHRARPDLVGVELTETALLHSLDGASAAMNELRARGIEVALDDFGTGYSSLAYLRQLPVDVLKIDRSFVSGMGDTLQDGAIVEAIIELAHALGLAVIAEGVESPRQVDELLALGANRAQGYLFARPAPATTVLPLLSRPWASWCGPQRDATAAPVSIDHRGDRFLGGGRRAVLLLTALDAITNPVVVTGRQRIVYVNAAFEATTGWTAASVIDQPVAILDAHPRQDAPHASNGDSDGACPAAAVSDAAGTTTFETSAWRADGSRFPCEVTRSPVASPGGAVHHWIEVRRDLTEQRHLEARLKRELAMRELNAAFAARCLSQPPEQVLDRAHLAELAEAVGDLLGVERVYLDVFSDDRSTLVMQARWTPAEGREIGDQRIPVALRPAWVETITTAAGIRLDGDQTDVPPWWHEQFAVFGVASPVQLAAPLRVNGRTYGVIGVGIDTPGHRRWDTDEVAFLRMLATSIASIFERVRVDRALRESEERYRAMAETAADVIVVADDAGMLSWVSPSIVELTGFRPDELIGTRWLSWVHPDDVEATRARHDELRSLGKVALEHRVRHRDQGWLWVQQVLRLVLDEDGTKAATRSSMRDLTAQKALEAELADRATRDPLTGLANRTVIEHRIDGFGRQQSGRVALMLVDLDGFKAVNDEYGHRVGDQLLRRVARRLSAVVRSLDVVSRWGGDEFVLLCPDIDEPVAAAIAARVVAVLGEPFVLDVGTVQIGASVGVAFPEPEEHDCQGLLAAADAAMYEAKRRGKGRAHLTFARTATTT